MGDRIGAYRLVKKLGEGETSCVYLAARDDQYRQWVAIKLIRPGVAALPTGPHERGMRARPDE